MKLGLPRGLQGRCIDWLTPMGAPVVTVVLKATFRLRPDVVEIATDGAEPIFDTEEAVRGHGGGVHRAIELVPGKAQAEMLLVGSAFAPDELPVQSLVARLRVGGVSKSVEVFGERWWQPDETLGQPTPWLSFPLTYEHAAGGPLTWNPIGVAVGTSGDSRMRRRAPSLVLPGASPRSPSAPTPVACFGPIPRAWPIRQERADALRRLAAAQSLRAESELMVNHAAPTDQLLDTLRGDEMVVLENLCRGSARLSFRLPGVAPRVFVPGALGHTRPFDDALGTIATADTLFIDTDQEILTLVWRSRHELTESERSGSYLVEWTRISEDPALAMAQDAILDDEAGQTVITKNRPWLREDAPAATDRKKPTVPEIELSSVTSIREHRTQPELVLAPPPPILRPHEHRTQPEIVLPPPPAPAPRVVPRPSPRASQIPPPPVLPSRAHEPQSGIRPAPEPGTVRFAWCDPRRISDLQQHPHYRSFIESWKREPPVSPSLAAPKEDELRTDAEIAFSRVLSGATPTPLDGLVDVSLLLAEGATLFVVEGELRLAFDEAQELAWTVKLARPLSKRGTRLRELLAQADELDGLPLGGTRAFVTDLTSRLRTAWADVSSELPPEFLKANVRDKLLTERAFTKRRVLGGTFVRGELLSSSGAAVATFIPETALQYLPLASTFAARMLVEIHPRQEESDPGGAALRAVGIALLVERR